jgi:hypothetical protein
MRTIAWLGLGLLALGSASCGGRVVGLVTPDSGVGADVAPPQRGQTDGAINLDVSTTPVDTGTTPPPPPPIDASVAMDAQPDRAADTGTVTPVVDAGTDVNLGRACQVVNPNACPAGSYCLSANCVTGNCVVAPVSAQASPVCGCDRITYWNAAVAATAGNGVRVDGACPAGVACGGIAALNCPNGSFCNFQVANATACNGADIGGRCWALPDVCPLQPAGTAPTNRRCTGNTACMTMCEMIRNERIYFTDATCPP